MPRSNISRIDPNEVESISILKDASATAVFGVRGANGVVMITTRRGQPGKSELSISVDHSLQGFLVKADRLHSWEFAELRNQAYPNDHPGADEADMPYTQYMIDKYRSGEARILPDRDVFHDYFRTKAKHGSTRTLTAGRTANYFLNVGYTARGNFKTEPKSFLGMIPVTAWIAITSAVTSITISPAIWRHR